MNTKTASLPLRRLFGTLVQRIPAPNSFLRGAALAIMAVSSLALLPSSASGQDAFLELEGIKGESTNSRHKNEIELIGFSSGVDNPLPYPGQDSTKPQFYEVRVAKKIDKSSPLLFMECATGRKFKKATLTLTKKIDGKGAKDDIVDYYKVVLSDVTITRVAAGGSAETGVGKIGDEEISLSFQKIEWIVTPLDARGKPGDAVKGGFDLNTNTPIN